MTLPRDAVPKEEFDLAEQGIRVAKKKVIPRPEPSLPIVGNELRFTEIPEGEIKDISARIHHPSVRNKDGMIFVGYDVEVFVGDKTFCGWMGEKNFFQLRRRIPVERVDLIQKISF